MNAKRRAGHKPAIKLVVSLLVAAICFTTLGFGVRGFTASRITDQIEVTGYYDNVDYCRQMRECAQDGSKYAMIVGEIYEEQRNFKIDKLHLPYEKTAFFYELRYWRGSFESNGWRNYPPLTKAD